VFSFRPLIYPSLILKSIKVEPRVLIPQVQASSNYSGLAEIHFYEAAYLAYLSWPWRERISKNSSILPDLVRINFIHERAMEQHGKPS